MEKKPKRRTKERILETSLVLFNDFGEPNVTTQLISDEMGISPGNLYYHFRSKDQIIETRFADFERKIDDILAVPARRVPNVEDVWLLLHLIFERIWEYRFLYRDINELLSRNRILETHFKRIIGHEVATIAAILQGLVATDDIRASTGEIQTLAVNVTVLSTYWLSFEFVRDPRRKLDGDALARGAFQCMALVAPYLVGRSKEWFQALSQEYLSSGN